MYSIVSGYGPSFNIEKHFRVYESEEFTDYPSLVSRTIEPCSCSRSGDNVALDFPHNSEIQGFEILGYNPQS